MKRLLLLSLLMIGFVGSLFAQAQVIPDETNWILIIISGLVALAEVGLRFFPNKKITGPLGMIINLLKFVSDYLNNK